MRQEIHLYPEHGLACLVDTIQEVDAFVDAAGMTAEQAHSFTAALEEYLTSIILYGFDGTSQPEIQITVKRERDQISCELVDNGAQFDPTASQKDQDQGSTQTDLRREMLAISMLQTTGGHHEWCRANGHNHLKLEYKIC